MRDVASCRKCCNNKVVSNNDLPKVIKAFRKAKGGQAKAWRPSTVTFSKCLDQEFLSGMPLEIAYGDPC